MPTSFMRLRSLCLPVYLERAMWNRLSSLRYTFDRLAIIGVIVGMVVMAFSLWMLN